MTVYLVSGFADITKKWANLPIRQPEQYKELGLKLLTNIPDCIHALLFLHTEFITFYQRVLTPEQLQRITFIPIELNELELFTDESFIEKCYQADRSFKIQFTGPRDATPFNLMTHTKATLLRFARQRLSDESSRLFWLDFGIAHTRSASFTNDLMKQYLTEIHDKMMSLPPNKVFCCSINYLGNNFIDRRTFYSRLRWNLAAGLIGATSLSALDRLVDMWLTEVRTCVNEFSILSCEEHIIGYLALLEKLSIGPCSSLEEYKSKSFFTWYYGDHSSVLSNVVRPRESYHLIHRAIEEARNASDPFEVELRINFLNSGV